MVISLKWLNDYVNIDYRNKKSVDGLCRTLTQLGLEVSKINPLNEKFENIITAEILEKEKHPNADKLSLCKVSDGSTVYSIVCGATNHKAGDKVLLAKIGAKVFIKDPSKTFEIKKSKIRGEISEGMLCSAEELSMEGEKEGIIILPSSTAVGIEAALALGQDDVVIEIELTPNRGDCLSHIGIARELSAYYKLPLNYPEWSVSEDEKEKIVLDYLKISKVDHEICPRYMARIVRDIKLGPSPQWMVERLQNVGIRSINNVVDITNFVLLEYGQPLHAFDFGKLEGDEILVRRALDGEKFKTLDGIERLLKTEDILICDGQRPVALGGIMGGENSGIYNDTKDVLIESAIFNPVNIRKTSKRLDLRTDASIRFEKKVDAYALHRALDRAAELMRIYASGRVVRWYHDVKDFDEKFRRKISLDLNYVNALLGKELPYDFVISCLSALEFETKVVSTFHVLDVFVPTFRNDVTSAADLVEELARFYGLDNIPLSLPKFHSNFYVPENPLKLEDKLKDKMVAFGFNEVVSYSFIKKEFEEDTACGQSAYPVFIANPVSEDMQVLRRSLFSGLISTLKYNVNRGGENLRLFEIGKTFESMTKEVSNSFSDIAQKKKIAILLSGGREELSAQDLNYTIKVKPYDYFDIKSVLDELIFKNKKGATLIPVEKIPFLQQNEGALVYVEDVYLGFIGKIEEVFANKYEIPLNTYISELDYSILEKIASKPFEYNQISKYPNVIRDLALIVDKRVLSQEISQAVKSLSIPAIEEVFIFDVYSGKNLPDEKKSLALRITYQSLDKTFTDQEIESIEKTVLNKLKTTFNAALRES